MNRMIAPFHSLVVLSSLAVIATLSLTTGCDSGKESMSEESAEAKIVLDTVPADVSCIRVTIAGQNREVVRDIEATTGQGISESLTGLPIGPVTFTADAYAVACTQVTRSTVATWISEPKLTNLVLGRISSVSLILTKNGRAKVSINFEDGTSPDAGGRD